MKKLYTAIAALLCFAASAQNKDNGLLWKISGNGLTKPSYLFGTIHITCDAALDKNVLTALDNTAQLYLELDMDDPAMQTQMLGGMMMNNGKTMKSLASEADFKLVDEFLLKNTGMGAALMNNFKPAMVTMLLYPKMMDCPMQSIETELMKVTKTQNEEVYGLETLADQMAVFDAIPYEEQMADLIEMAKGNMMKQKAEFAELMEVYKTQDLAKIQALIDNPENKMMSGHSDILLANRNKKWIPKIQETAKKTPTFFGVGAAHLPGDNGVINLLRKKGFKVEAMN